MTSSMLNKGPLLAVVLIALVALAAAQTTLPKCGTGVQTQCVLSQFTPSVLDCLGDDTSRCNLVTFCDLPKWQAVKACFDRNSCDGMFWGAKECAQLVGICSNAAAMEAGLCPVKAPVTPAPPSLTSPPDAETILRELYAATNGPRWRRNTNWLVGSYCTWFGVTCAGTAVTHLRLGINGLKGRLPASLGTLYSLVHLDLAENEVEGPISIFKNLVGLTFLTLGPKRLTSICVFPYQGPGMEDCLGWPDGGQMEGSYGVSFKPVYTGDYVDMVTNLPLLKVFTLTGTEVYGKFDERLCKLTQLEYWHLIVVANTTGYIPNCLPAAMNNTLEVFLSSDSHIAGTLPHDISKMQKLRQFGLSFNDIEGTIPPFAPNLMHYFLNDNKFSGPLPEAQEWRAPNDRVKSNLMESFLAYTNNLTGTLPASYAKMKNFKYLWVSDNKLSGTVPVEWAALDNMLMVAMDRNQLEGPIPSVFGSWHTAYGRDQVPEPYCTGCSLGFLIPDSIFPIRMGLSILRLRDNKFSGTIPASVASHPFLYDLELMNNRLSGKIEDIITDGPWRLNMRNLNLRGNNIGGSLHLSALCKWQTIDILELSYNNIGGSLPDCIGNVSQIRQLRLGNNAITGNIPRSIGGMKKLLLAYLNNNQLTGSIPREVEGLVSLRNWNSGFNRLSGNLYDNLRHFGEIPTLTTVNLENNTISGFMTLFVLFEVNVDILWPTLKSWNLANNRIQGSIPFVFDQYVQEISYLNIEGNQFNGNIPNFPNLDVMLLARNPEMRTDTSEPLPAFLRATEFMVRQDPTYACPVITGADRAMVVSLDPEYYGYRLCTCEAGYFGRPPNCRPCLPGGVCDGKSQYMRIPAGLFPTPNVTHPQHLIRCPTDSVSSETSMCNPDGDYNFTCKEGYSGRLCSLCLDGYYQKGSRCLECPGVGQSIAIILCVFIALVVAALLLRALPKGNREAVLVLKVLILYMQFAGTFLTKTSLVWPSSLMGLNRVFDISNVNLGFFSCAAGRNIVDLNTESEIWGIIVFFCLAFAVLGFLVVFFELLNWIQTNEKVEDVESVTHDDTNWDMDIAERLEEEQDNARLYFNYHRSIFETTDTTVKKMKPKFYIVRGVITLLKFLYLPITTSVLQLFQCEEDPGLDGRRFMTFNPPRECSFDDPIYVRNIVFAAFLIPLYIIGFPAFICLIAVRYDLREKVARNVWYFLFQDFKPGHAMYIMWQLARQLILSVICVLVPKEANVTLILLVLHFFAMVMVHLYFEPYMEQAANFNEGIAFTCLCLTLCFGLVNSQSVSAQQETIAAMLMITQIVFLLCVLYAFLIAGKFIPKSVAKRLPWYTFITYHKHTKNASDALDDPNAAGGAGGDKDSLSGSMSGSFAMSPSGGGFRGRSMLEIYGRGSKAELRDWLENGQSILAIASRSTYAATNAHFDAATRDAIDKVITLQRLFADVEAQRKAERGTAVTPSSAGRTPATVTPSNAHNNTNSDSLDGGSFPAPRGTNGNGLGSSQKKYESSAKSSSGLDGSNGVSEVEDVEMQNRTGTEAFREDVEEA